MSAAITAAVGGAIIGGAISNRGTRNAAESQRQAGQASIDEQRRQFDLTRGDQLPWMTAGQGAIGQMGGYIQPGGEFNRSLTRADIEGDPVYQMQYESGLRSGENALRRQLAATGMRNSGSALKALTEYGSDYTARTAGGAWDRIQSQLGNRWNRLAGVAGVGQQAVQNVGQLGSETSGRIGNALIGTGNARGASQVANANMWGNIAQQGIGLGAGMWGQPARQPYYRSPYSGYDGQ